jgi:transketolase
VDDKTLSVLQSKSREIRADILRSLAEAGSGHTGGSLGLTDLFATLYFHILEHNPEAPDWEERDRLILSIGHVAPVLYTTLAHAGYFPREELLTLRKFGSRLQGHPGRDHGLPGLELSAGSLGQGLSVAVGMALSAKMDQKTLHVYSVNGDGEMQEGSIWEAAMSASHYKLDNLTAFIDRNGLQIDGRTSDVMEIEPLERKWQAFGWEVIQCNGHDHRQIAESVEHAKYVKGKPTVIILKTIMVPSIEGDYRWHGKAPSREQLAGFLRELY